MAAGLIAGLTLAQTGLSIASGFSQQDRYKLQAQQAGLDAKSAELERREALQDALAMQAVIAASGGRAAGSGSLEAIRLEDMRRADQDIQMIKSGGRATQASLKAAGGFAKGSAITKGLLSAGSTIAKTKQVK